MIAGVRNVFAIDPVEARTGPEIRCDAGVRVRRRSDERDRQRGACARKVIVTVGEVHGTDVDTWMSITAKAGTCVLTGMGNMMENQVTLNLSMLTLLQKNLQGSIFGGANPKLDIPLLLSMYKAGKLNIADMITRQYRLDQVNEGYTDMLEGRNIRGIIRYTEQDW